MTSGFSEMVRLGYFVFENRPQNLYKIWLRSISPCTRLLIKVSTHLFETIFITILSIRTLEVALISSRWFFVHSHSHVYLNDFSYWPQLPNVSAKRIVSGILQRRALYSTVQYSFSCAYCTVCATSRYDTIRVTRHSHSRINTGEIIWGKSKIKEINRVFAIAIDGGSDMLSHRSHLWVECKAFCATYSYIQYICMIWYNSFRSIYSTCALCTMPSRTTLISIFALIMRCCGRWQIEFYWLCTACRCTRTIIAKDSWPINTSTVRAAHLTNLFASACAIKERTFWEANSIQSNSHH